MNIMILIQLSIDNSDDKLITRTRQARIYIILLNTYKFLISDSK